MSNLEFRTVTSLDAPYIDLIAHWYLMEWNIPREKTKENLSYLSPDLNEFQLLIYLNDEPIGTAGIYTHVGIIDKIPRLSIHKHWLALVYTVPEMRGNGYGEKLCLQVEEKARLLGIETITLFTHSAQNLYLRMGWSEIESLTLNEKHVVIMQKDL